MKTSVALTFTVLSLTACVEKSPVQRIQLESGNFGVAELATIVAIDPVILQQNIVRFDVSFGEFAVSLLRENSATASDIWGETVRAFGSAFAAELEDYIRGLACVYTVNPQGSFISGAVADAVRFSGDDDDDIGTVIAGSGVLFDDASTADTDRSSNRLASVIAEERQSEADNQVEVSVVSNCLLDVYADDEVRIVQTPQRMIILPQPKKPESASELPDAAKDRILARDIGRAANSRESYESNSKRMARGRWGTDVAVSVSSSLRAATSGSGSISSGSGSVSSPASRAVSVVSSSGSPL